MNEFQVNQIAVARVMEKQIVELQFVDRFVGRLDFVPALDRHTNLRSIPESEDNAHNLFRQPFVAKNSYSALKRHP